MIWPLSLAAYGLLEVGLIAVGRAGIELYTLGRYVNVALGLWFAVVLLALVMLYRPSESAYWPRLTAYFSLTAFGVLITAGYALFAMVLMPAYPNRLFANDAEYMLLFPTAYPSQRLTEAEWGPLDPRGVTPEKWHQFEVIHRMALYRLAGYRQVPAQNILPGYAAGQLVIIVSPNIWMNLSYREFLLAGVPEGDILHAGGAGVLADANTFDPPPDDVWGELDAAAAAEIIARMQGGLAWVISAKLSQQEEATLLAAAEDAGLQVIALADEPDVNYRVFLLER